MHVKNAHKVPDHHVITFHVLPWNATKIKSSDLTTSAHNVNGAQLDHSQIQREKPVSFNQDQLSTLVESQPAVILKSSTSIELNVFHVQLTQRPQRTT